MITDDGKYYLFFHQRFSDRGEYHEVCVRQQFLNENIWLVTAVYEYKSEKISIYEEAEVIGDYELVNHGNAEKDGNMIRTQRITLQKGGNVSGDMTGTWIMTKGDKYCYVTFKFNGVIYKGVFFRQTNDNGEKKMTFTEIGKNNLNLWGSSVFTSIDLTASWPKTTPTKSLSALIIVKAGETYDTYAINGNPVDKKINYTINLFS